MGDSYEDGRSPPRVLIDRLTDDQTAMLTLLGLPEAGKRRASPLYFMDTPPGVQMISPKMNPHIVMQYLCPVVRFRDRLKMVLPNGDLMECGDEAVDYG
jgi:hypothetical protein